MPHDSSVEEGGCVFAPAIMHGHDAQLRCNSHRNLLLPLSSTRPKLALQTSETRQSEPGPNDGFHMQPHTRPPDSRRSCGLQLECWTPSSPAVTIYPSLLWTHFFLDLPVAYIVLQVPKIRLAIRTRTVPSVLLTRLRICTMKYP
ncbi:hypothetical protein AB1N83_010571 [Pleurotus pulmonarius]